MKLNFLELIAVLPWLYASTNIRFNYASNLEALSILLQF
jgi:hypothetical protein